MNKLLLRQIQKHFGNTETVPEDLTRLLNVVSDTYDQYERDRKMIERSIDLSSDEMIGLNDALKKEKEELKKVYGELDILFENIDSVLFSVDMVSYQLTQMTSACERIYGYTSAEFFVDGRLWQSVVHPDDRHLIQLQINTLNEGRQVHSQWRVIHKDKSIRWLEHKITPTMDENGRLIRMDGVTHDISERKYAESELEKSFSLLEATLESTTDGLLVVDLNGNMVRFNNKLLELWRIPGPVLKNLNREEAMNLVLDQLLNPDEFINKINELTLKESEVSFDILLFRDGRIFERNSQPHLIAGKCVGRVWGFRDITERKRAEDRMRKSEETRRLIMQAAMDAIICIDRSGNIIFWNPQAENIFGWEEDEVMHKELSGFIIPERFRKMHQKGFNLYKDTGHGNLMNLPPELTGLRKNGDEFPIELRISAIQHADGEFFCAFIRDITERKKAENEIRVSNERYNLASKATSDIIWDWDLLTGEVIRSEENMIRLLGYPKEISQHHAFDWMALVHADDIERITIMFDAFLLDPDKYYLDDEYRFMKADGTYAYLYDKGYIIRDSTGKAIRIIGSTQDISRLKENELQLKKRAEELALSNLELEQFAFVTSHDLQEPLRMITSFLSQLEKKYDHVLDEKGKKYIHFAVDGAKRMRQIILDLLEYSRVGRNDTNAEELDMNELLKEIKLLLQKKIMEKNATITIDKLPCLNSYRAPIRQVFQNLISNALKYSKRDINPTINISVQGDELHWLFSVTDNGIGIEEEYFEKVFVLFQRLHDKNEYSGTGMGLAVSKKIVENLGGKIWVESQEGKGSTFYFTIPK
jgi:PAS domain S-box-containing protein